MTRFQRHATRIVWSRDQVHGRAYAIEGAHVGGPHEAELGRSVGLESDSRDADKKRDRKTDEIGQTNIREPPVRPVACRAN